MAICCILPVYSNTAKKQITTLLKITRNEQSEATTKEKKKVKQ